MSELYTTNSRTAFGSIENLEKLPKYREALTKATLTFFRFGTVRVLSHTFNLFQP